MGHSNVEIYSFFILLALSLFSQQWELGVWVYVADLFFETAARAAVRRAAVWSCS